MKIQLSDAGLISEHPVVVRNEYSEQMEKFVTAERPLTIKVDGKEIVTVMTIGMHPEALTLGYLRNQRLIAELKSILSVTVDWDREQVAVITEGNAIINLEEKLQRKIVTSGCGQGSILSCTLGELYEVELSPPQISQSQIYSLLKNVFAYNDVYKKSGSVHGCALCQGQNVLYFVEDVGRHNAVDALAGYMWLENLSGDDKILYTTGRLTSEIVMKAAFMGIPVLLSRSGITQMGLELAQQLDICMIARAKGKRFLLYNGEEHFSFDAIPKRILDRLSRA